MCLKHLFVTIFLIGCIQNGFVGVNSFDIQLNDLLKMQKGLGWPHMLRVVVGNEALIKLTKTVTNQMHCTAMSPVGESFDVSSPPSNRFESWGDGCGLRVRQVLVADTGRWRLTSTSGSDSVTGWIELNVNEDPTNYTAPAIVLQDGETAEVDLVSLDNSYCLVAQPFSQSSLVPGHCRVVLDKATRAVQGNWNILVGLPGRISELHVDRRINVQAERLDVGYVRDTTHNKLNLYCNILHTTKNVTFCRFQKTTDSFGYNVMEGLSDGVHSYYGDGFLAKHCGMTIENPTQSDYGAWRCSVGSQQWAGNDLVQQAPLQALVNVPAALRLNFREESRQRSDKEETTVFVQKNLSFTIMCKAQFSLAYCWFRHPNGSHFSPTAQTSEDQTFWYTGESLQFGDCGITFSHADPVDEGAWECHMGVDNQPGIEINEIVHVRVTGPLAAVKNEINVVVGEEATLYCQTANGIKPLDYCRFFTPSLVGLSIDTSVTKENAILGRYYFTPERSLDYGDCSLTITAVEEEDVGEWTCGALINNDIMEASDVITVMLSGTSDTGRPPLSQAGIVGMAAGVVILVVTLAGVVWYKAGLPIPTFRRNRPSTPSDNGIPFDVMSSETRSDGGTSMESTNSAEMMHERSQNSRAIDPLGAMTP